MQWINCDQAGTAGKKSKRRKAEPAEEGGAAAQENQVYCHLQVLWLIITINLFFCPILCGG